MFLSQGLPDLGSSSIPAKASPTPQHHLRRSSLHFLAAGVSRGFPQDTATSRRSSPPSEHHPHSFPVTPPLAHIVGAPRSSPVLGDHSGPAAARHLPATTDQLRSCLHRPRDRLCTSVPFCPHSTSVIASAAGDVCNSKPA